MLRLSPFKLIAAKLIMEYDNENTANLADQQDNFERAIRVHHQPLSAQNFMNFFLVVPFD